jgi:cbb3-type cytochrome oxidase maturation protein
VTVWTTLLLIGVSLALGFAAWLLFLWAVKSDQYDDVERPKHRMLDDDAKKDGERTDQADPARTPAPPPDRT